MPHVIVFSLIGVLTIIGLSIAGMPAAHSATFNYPWAIAYSETIGPQTILPRHLPDIWFGLGGYDFFFYAPLPFWFNSVVLAPLCSDCSASTIHGIGGGIFLILSGLTFRSFLREFFDRSAATAGAIVFMFLPYHFALDWFVRNSVGEFSTYVFLPIVALGVEKLRKGKGHGWLVAVGVAGTSLSHLPTTLLAAHVFGILSIILTIGSSRRGADRLLLFSRITGWTVLGLLMSAVYWVPAVMLLGSVSPSVLYSEYYTATRWLIGFGLDQPDTDFILTLLLSFVSVLPVIVLGAIRTKGALRIWILTPVLFCCVLNLRFSAPVWEYWILGSVQFPWRLLVFVDLSAGIAAAVLAREIVQRPMDSWLKAKAILMVVPTALFLGLQPSLRNLPGPMDHHAPWVGAFEYLSPEMIKQLETRLGDGQVSHNNLEAVKATMFKIADRVHQVSARQLRILQRDSRHLKVEILENTPRVSMPVQYWSFWQAETLDGVALETAAHPSFGTLDLIVSGNDTKGQKVTLRLPLQRSEWIGIALSPLAILILPALVVGGRRRREN